MQNNFCRAFTNGLCFRNNGVDDKLYFDPCCYYDDKTEFTTENYNLFREKAPYLTSFEKTGRACHMCEDREIIGKKSLRHWANEDIPEGIDQDLYKLELSIDTTCNAACIQCGPEQSSLWRKQLLKHTSKYKTIIEIQDENSIDKKLEKILSTVDISKVKIFQFWGGEPLITDTHLKVLRLVKDFSDKQIMFTSNCGAFPSDELIEILYKCKYAHINLSIDGIDDVFNYMRWPLKWDKASTILKRYKELNLKNAFFQPNFCITPLNVFYASDFYQWHYDNLSSSPFPEKLDRVLFVPVHDTLNFAYTPQKLRDVLLQKYGPTHTINNFINSSEVLDPTPMINYLNFWDEKRGLSWKNTFSEIIEYFDK